MADSICGTDVNIEHINDNKVKYFEEGVIDKDYKKVITGSGMPIKKRDGYFGNLIIEYQITFPKIKLTDEQKSIIRSILPSLDNN